MTRPIIRGAHTAAPTAPANTEVRPLLLGPLVGGLVLETVAGAPATFTPIAPTRYNSAAFATSGVVVVGARRLVEVHGLLSSASGVPRWLHLFNAAAIPANGTVPFSTPVSLPVGGTQVSVSYEHGDPYTVGIVFACSTTEATLTLTVAAELWIDARHIPS